MVYIFNKYIQPKKTISNALTIIFGIGKNRALQICHALCINPNKRFFELLRTKSAYISTIHKYISDKSNWKNIPTSKVASLLSKEIHENIKNYIKIRCYRGLRHKLSLPVRGQRTHTNAQTQRKSLNFKNKQSLNKKL